MGLPVEGNASYPSTLTAMASTAGGGGGGGGGVDPTSTAGMLASVADPGWTPPPVEPVPGVDYAGLSGLGGGGGVAGGEAAGGASGGLAPDSMEDPYGDKELQSRLAGLEQLPQAAVPPTRLVPATSGRSWPAARSALRRSQVSRTFSSSRTLVREVPAKVLAGSLRGQPCRRPRPRSPARAARASRSPAEARPGRRRPLSGMTGAKPRFLFQLI